MINQQRVGPRHPHRTESAPPPRRAAWPAAKGGDMPGQALRVLISGASVAGPTAAYWLSRQGSR